MTGQLSRAGQHGGEPERTLAHRLVEKLLHGRDLGAAGAGERITLHALEQRAEPDIAGHVDGDALVLERLEIAAERRPGVGCAPRGLTVRAERFPLAGPAEVSSPRISVVTPWRTLLGALPSSSRVMSECECMSMNPGATTSPRASMTFRAAASGSSAPTVDDPVAANGHVAQEPGIARPVDDRAAADQAGRMAARAGRGRECPRSRCCREEQPS